MQFRLAKGGKEKRKKISVEIIDHHNETLIELRKLKQEDLLEYWDGDKRKKMMEKWKNIISKIKFQVFEVADHVQIWSYAKTISNDFADIMISRNYPCDKYHPCKKCAEKKTSNESLINHFQTQQDKEDILQAKPSTSGVKKPYSFKRSKVNFTMEDLENSSGEEDKYSMYL